MKRQFLDGTKHNLLSVRRGRKQFRGCQETYIKCLSVEAKDEHSKYILEKTRHTNTNEDRTASKTAILVSQDGNVRYHVQSYRVRTVWEMRAYHI